MTVVLKCSDCGGDVKRTRKVLCTPCRKLNHRKSALKFYYKQGRKLRMVKIDDATLEAKLTQSFKQKGWD